jgi:hypothetical protein
MRGLCRNRSNLTAVLSAVLVSGILLAATTAPTRAADHESGPNEDWPLRTFAQPAFQPDFAAMTATIVAEPAPAGTAPAAAVSILPAAPIVNGPSKPQTSAGAASRSAQTLPPVTPKLRLESTWPKTLPAAKPAPGEAPQQNAEATDAFTPAEIAEAKAHCTALLKGVDAVAIPEEPIRQGICGTAAPFQLISVGRNPQVTFNPPAIVTCDMVAAVTTWVKNDLQPAARRHLGSPLAKIDTMSSYSCRNAYGRKRANLSEHGRANALDIRSFVTAAQAESEVLAHWGPTGREVRAQVAAAKAAAEKATAERAMAVAKVPLRSTVPPGSPETGDTATTVAGAVGTMIGSVPSLAARLPGAKSDTGLGLSPPSRLGGPKPADRGPVALAAKGPPAMASSRSTEQNQAGRMQFLREAHASACRIFGTVLGPESNDAHKNHFHVDMAERPNAGHFCE